MAKPIIELNRSEIKELEKFVKVRIEYIVFNTKRPKKKKKGGNKIEDDTGNLRKQIKGAKNFIEQTERGIKINFPTTDYFKYLDDERRDELNWYLSEAIFEDKLFREKLREIYAQSGMRAILKVS